MLGLNIETLRFGWKSGKERFSDSVNIDHKWICIKEQITRYKLGFEKTSDHILFFLSGPSEVIYSVKTQYLYFIFT